MYIKKPSFRIRICLAALALAVITTVVVLQISSQQENIENDCHSIAHAIKMNNRIIIEKLIVINDFDENFRKTNSHCNGIISGAVNSSNIINFTDLVNSSYADYLQGVLDRRSSLSYRITFSVIRATSPAKAASLILEEMNVFSMRMKNVNLIASGKNLKIASLENEVQKKLNGEVETLGITQ